MSSIKISQAEADALLNMLKKTLLSRIDFPSKGKSIEFDVSGERINNFKYNIGARIVKNGILLLELHINPSNIHTNPDGEKITGSHWHIYSEKHGRLWAFPAEDLDDKQFVQNTIVFLEKFNVIEKPAINFQAELL